MQEVEKIYRSKMSRPHGATKRNMTGGNRKTHTCPHCLVTFRGSWWSVNKQVSRHLCAGMFQEV